MLTTILICFRSKLRPWNLKHENGRTRIQSFVSGFLRFDSRGPQTDVLDRSNDRTIAYIHTHEPSSSPYGKRVFTCPQSLGKTPWMRKGNPIVNSPEETPNPRRDSKKTGRYHVYYCLWRVLSPCFLRVPPGVWSLFWAI